MTAEQLEELLGKVTQGEWDKFEGENGFWFIEAERGMIGENVAGDALEYDAALISLAPSLARRVIAAEKLVEAAQGMKRIVEEIDGAMKHGTWRDENGLRLKDTSEWVALYNALNAYREANK